MTEQPSAEDQQVVQTSSDVTNQPSAEDAKTASFKLYLNNPIQFVVNRHKGPGDQRMKIFQDFEVKLRRYGFSRDELYWIDGGHHRRVRDDVDLEELTHDVALVHLYTASSGKQSLEERKRSRRYLQERPNCLRFMLHRERLPQFSVAYKEKDELFEELSKKLKNLGIPLENLYYIDYDNYKAKPLSSADDVITLAGSYHCVQLYTKDVAEAYISLETPYHVPVSENDNPHDEATLHRSTRYSSNKTVGSPRHHHSSSRHHRPDYHYSNGLYDIPFACSMNRHTFCPTYGYSRHSWPVDPCFGFCHCRCYCYGCRSGGERLQAHGFHGYR